MLAGAKIFTRAPNHHGDRTAPILFWGYTVAMLISKYGFTSVLADGLVVLDPSCVAAQIVTGIGSIGSGLIFVREDRVQGLTTAATVCLVTAIGMACAAGLLVLALGAALAYFIVAFVFPLSALSSRRADAHRTGQGFGA